MQEFCRKKAPKRLFSSLFSQAPVNLREHPPVEVLVARAALRYTRPIFRVLLLPDSRLLDIFFAILLRVITHPFDIVRHALRGLDHLSVPRRAFRPRTFVEMVGVY